MNKEKYETAEHEQRTTAAEGPAHTREQLADSRRYARHRDLICALLEDGERCTPEELDGRINTFLKGKVK